MKKSRKSKIVLLSVLGLATVSLATVGFASWVINYITPATEQNITVSAGTVTENSLTATILDNPEPELKVAFDNKKVDNGIGGTYAEDLDFRFSVKVTGSEDVLSGIKFTFKLNDQFEKLFTDGYLQFITNNNTGSLVKEFTIAKDTNTIVEPNVTFADSINSNVTYSAGTFTCNFAFKWGSKFENKNPSECYASKSNDSDKATVITNLKAFDTEAKKLPASGWMSVVVTPVAKASA